MMEIMNINVAEPGCGRVWKRVRAVVVALNFEGSTEAIELVRRVDPSFKGTRRLGVTHPDLSRGPPLVVSTPHGGMLTRSEDDLSLS